MRKKVSLILVLLLSVILVVSFVACNRDNVNVDDLPDQIQQGGNENTPSDQNTAREELLFHYNKPNSFIKSLELDSFKLEEDILWRIKYTSKDGKTVTYSAYEGLKEEMIDEADRPNLTKPGHHTMHVTATTESGNEIKASFTLHLMRNSAFTRYLNVTFVMGEGGNATFGKTDTTGNVTTTFAEGYQFNTWQEFLFAFPMTKKDGANRRYAVKSVTDGEEHTLSATEGFPYELTEDTTFTVEWSLEVVNVTFDLNLPAQRSFDKDAEGNVLVDGKQLLVDGEPVKDPEALFSTRWGEQTVMKRTGRIAKPITEEFNVFSGLDFGGWYTAKYQVDENGDPVYEQDDHGIVYNSDGTPKRALEKNPDGSVVVGEAWNFNATVEEQDVALYALWIERQYTFTLFTEGGELNVNSATVLSTLPVGYSLVESTSYFVHDRLMQMVFSGFKYNIPYDQYAFEVTTDDSGTVGYVPFAGICSTIAGSDIFVKGDGTYLTISGLYKDYACTESVNMSMEEGGHALIDSSAFVGWKFNAPSAEDANYDSLYHERISKLYTEMLFNGNGAMTIKADGSIRLDQVIDEDANEVIIPDYIFLSEGGEMVRHNITEINANAFDNLQGLNTVDFSKATNLTTIGAGAFFNSMHLNTVIGLDKLTNLTSIGVNAFAGTEFENDFSEDASQDYIIINGILYKYVGDDKVTNLDLSDQDVKYIMSGAFSNATQLETVKLPLSVITIENDAFKGLLALKTVEFPEESDGHSIMLSSVGENAFEALAPILVSGKSGNEYESTSSILLGHGYYRMVNRTRTSVTIPQSVTFIANRAFMGCTELVNISFEDPSKITSIGKNAFIDTAFIRNTSEDFDKNTYVQDGFTVIGGKLVEYFGGSTTVNAVVPTYGDVNINAYAFGVNAAFLNTLRLGANVKSIADYSFAEVSNLRTLILNGMDVDENGYTLDDSLTPAISDNSFANANGLALGMKYYVRQSVIDFFENYETLTQGKEVDAKTQAWYRLYSADKTAFAVEKITGIRVETSAIESVLLRTKTGSNAFLTRYAEDGETFNIPNALYIISNTGVNRYEALTSDMEVKFHELTLTSNAPAESGYTEYYIEFKYQNVVWYTHSGEADSHNEAMVAADEVVATDPDFIITVYEAIKAGTADAGADYRPFTQSEHYNSGAETPSIQYLSQNSPTNGRRNFYFSGLDSDANTNGGDTYFAYWTTHGEFDIEFHYFDLNGVEHVISNYQDEAGVTHRNITMYTEGGDYLNRLPLTVSSSTTVVLRVNFYGLGTIDVKLTYRVQSPLYNEMNQVSAISMPLNSNGITELAKHSVELVRQNGTRDMLPIRVGGELYFDESQVDTTTLGMHTLTMTYISQSEVATQDRTLTLTLTYVVALEADLSFYTYRVTETYSEAQKDAYGQQVWGEATIRSVVNNNARTLVIPSVYTEHYDSEGKVTTDPAQYDDENHAPKNYKIVSLGESGRGSATANTGAFEGLTNLVSVYLSSNITHIYSNTFKGCTNLKNVYTAQKTTAKSHDFDGEYDLVGDTYVENGVTYQNIIIKSVNASMYDNQDDNSGKQHDLVIEKEYVGDGMMMGDYVEPFELEDAEDAATAPKLKGGDSFVTYRVVGVHPSGIRLPDPTPEEATDRINLYLPDTVYGTVLVYDYNGNVVSDSINDIANVWFFAADGEYKFKVYERLNAALKYIDNSVFEGCVSLDSLDFTTSTELAYIGYRAFYNSGLVSVDLTKNTLMTEINDMTFASCKQLEFVGMSENINFIGTGAFNGDEMLGEFGFYDESGAACQPAISKIRKDAFNNCKSLTEMKLWNGITEIESGAFTGCSALTIYVEFDATSKPSKWATGWDRLGLSTTRLDLPVVYQSATNDVANNGYAYYVEADAEQRYAGMRFAIDKTAKQAIVSTQPYNCSEEIYIPATVTYKGETYPVVQIGEDAFFNNNRIRRVTVATSNNLSRIAANAFSGCSRLETFVFEAGDDDNRLSFVDSMAFSGTMLADPPHESPNIVIDGFQYSLNATTQDATVSKYTINSEDVKTATIPATVTYNNKIYNITGIDPYAFDGNQYLENVVIGRNITTINDYAFSSCTKLNTIEFESGDPTQLTSVGGYAFIGCTALKTTYVTDGSYLYKLSDQPDAQGTERTASILRYIGYGSGDVMLYDTVVADDKTYYVTELSKGTFVVRVGTLVMPYQLVTIEGGRKSKFNILEISPWKERIAEHFLYIDDDGLYYELNWQEDDLWAVAMGFYAGGSEDIYTAYIEASITIVGSGGEYELKVTEIAENAFYNDIDLDAVIVRGSTSSGTENLEKIGANAFYNCISLTDIVLPSTITTVDPTAFVGCRALTISIDKAKEDGTAFSLTGDWAAGRPVVYNYRTNDVADNGYIYYIERDENSLPVGLRYALDPNTNNAYVATQPYNLGIERGDDGAPLDVREIHETINYSEYTVEGKEVSCITHLGSYTVIGIGANAFEGIDTSVESVNTIHKVKIPKTVTYIGEHAFKDSTLSEILFETDEQGNNLIGLTNVAENAFENTINIIYIYYTHEGYLYAMDTTALHNAYILNFFGTETSGNNAVILPSIPYMEEDYTIVQVRAGALAKADTITVYGDIEFANPNETQGKTIVYVSNGVQYRLSNEQASEEPDKKQAAVIGTEEYFADAEGEVVERYIVNEFSFNGVGYSVTSIEAGALKGVDRVIIEKDLTIAEGALNKDDEGGKVELYFNHHDTNVQYRLYEEGNATAVGLFIRLPEENVVTIQASVTINGKEYKVTEIGDDAFAGHSLIHQVVILSAGTRQAVYNLVAIGARAFSECYGLSEFTFENGDEFAPRCLERIGENAFQNCYSLNTIYIIRDDILYGIDKDIINDNASPKATVLKYVGEKDSVVILDELIVPGENGRDLAIPVIAIGADAFDGEAITSVTVSKDLVANDEFDLYDLFFIDKAHGTRYQLIGGESYKATLMGFIEESSFNTLTVNASITFNSHEYLVTDIASDAFSGNGNLVSVVIEGENLTTIGANAFDGLVGLTEIRLPSSVTSIQSEAFANCTSLTIVCDFPEATANSFAEGWNGTSPVVYNDKDGVATDGKVYYTEKGLRYVLDKSEYKATLAVQGALLSGVVTIPDEVTYLEEPYKVVAVGEGAFRGNNAITEVVLGKNVERIEDYAFASMSSLRSVSADLNGALGYVSENAYDSSDSLTTRPYVIDEVLYWFITVDDTYTAYILRYVGAEETFTLDNYTVEWNAQQYSIVGMLTNMFPETVKKFVAHYDENNVLSVYGEFSSALEVYYERDGYYYQLSTDNTAKLRKYYDSLNPSGSVDITVFAEVAPNWRKILGGDFKYTVTAVAADALDMYTVTSITAEKDVTMEGSVPGTAQLYMYDAASGVKLRLQDKTETVGADPGETYEHVATVLGLYDNGDERDILTIPESVTFNAVTYYVTEIDANAFKDNTFIRTVSIPASLVKIGSKAFAGTTALIAFTFAADEEGNTVNNLREIAEDAFENSNLAEPLRPTLPSEEEEMPDMPPAPDMPSEDDHNEDERA